MQGYIFNVMEGRGGPSGHVAKEAFCLKSAPAPGGSEVCFIHVS